MQEEGKRFLSFIHCTNVCNDVQCSVWCKSLREHRHTYRIITSNMKRGPAFNTNSIYLLVYHPLFHRCNHPHTNKFGVSLSTELHGHCR